MYLKEVAVSAKAAAQAAEGISGEATAQYGDRVSELLFRIDNFNSSAQKQMRAAYMVYKSSPCTHLDYLTKAIDSIHEKEHALKRADAAVRHVATIVEAFKDGNIDLNGSSFRIGDNLAKAIDFLRDPPVAATLVNQMENVEANTAAWKSDV